MTAKQIGRVVGGRFVSDDDADRAQAVPVDDDGGITAAAIQAEYDRQQQPTEAIQTMRHIVASMDADQLMLDHVTGLAELTEAIAQLALAATRAIARRS